MSSAFIARDKMARDKMLSDKLTHDELACHVRELLLCGHLIDRATMPHVLARWDRETMRDIAIDEWMGASPIYTKRMQRLLNFVGDDVETIFKGMQFDIGAPPQFMDFRYTVHDAEHGEFHLDHCGALMDVEPMGEDYVFTMCHDIEDPTFDATAWATNPRARMRPIHRPPRQPSDRQPHCAWTVTIDADAPALAEPEMATMMAKTPAANVPLPAIAGNDGNAAIDDYAGPLVSDIDFAAFSAGTLGALADEIALQGHLLANASMRTIAGRFDVAAAKDVGAHQLNGAAGIAAERLRDAHNFGSNVQDIATLLAIHPLFQPSSYVSATVTVHENEVHVIVGDAPSLHEEDGLSWIGLLVAGDGTPVQVIAQALDPSIRAQIAPLDAGELLHVVLRSGFAPAPRHPDVALVQFSTGATFRFAPAPVPVHVRPRQGPQKDR